VPRSAATASARAGRGGGSGRAAGAGCVTGAAAALGLGWSAGPGWSAVRPRRNSRRRRLPRSSAMPAPPSLPCPRRHRGPIMGRRRIGRRLRRGNVARRTWPRSTPDQDQEDVVAEQTGHIRRRHRNNVLVILVPAIEATPPPTLGRLSNCGTAPTGTSTPARSQQRPGDGVSPGACAGRRSPPEPARAPRVGARLHRWAPRRVVPRGLGRQRASGPRPSGP
jgi:hypothetical protein